MILTSRGCGVLIGGAALLAAGYVGGYPELSVLGAVGVVALLCAGVYAAWWPRLEVSRRVDPDRVERGEDATMELTVRARGRFRPATLIAKDRCGDRELSVPLLRVRSGRVTEVTYPVPTQRRGVVPIGPLRITRRDALGLITLTRRYGPTAQVRVHPRVHPLVAVPAGVARSLDGRFDRVPHGTITFDTLREYVIGDELRKVHWRTSARIGELMVREDVDTSLPRLVVLLDNRASAYPDRVDGVAETFESACEAAASIVVAAVREDLPVALMIVDDDPPIDGDHLDRLTEVRLRDRPGVDPQEPLRTAAMRLRQQRAGDTLIFLTGPGARDDLGHIGALRGPYATVLVGVLHGDAAEAAHARTVDPMLIINARDGADFAAEWNGVPAW